MALAQRGDAKVVPEAEKPPMPRGSSPCWHVRWAGGPFVQSSLGHPPGGCREAAVNFALIVTFMVVSRVSYKDCQLVSACISHVAYAMPRPTIGSFSPGMVVVCRPTHVDSWHQVVPTVSTSLTII